MNTTYILNVEGHNDFLEFIRQMRAHLQFKFELLDVNRQKFNKSMKYGNIGLKFMKNWQLEYHVVYFS